jgi:hypothetical protein
MYVYLGCVHVDRVWCGGESGGEGGWGWYLLLLGGSVCVSLGIFFFSFLLRVQLNIGVCLHGGDAG